MINPEYVTPVMLFIIFVWLCFTVLNGPIDKLMNFLFPVSKDLDDSDTDNDNIKRDFIDYM